MASAAKQWFSADGTGGEILCAQIMVTRFASGVDASLAEADSWSELHAGNASFRPVTLDSDDYRVAVVSDAGMVHTLAYGAVGNVAVAAFTSDGDVDVCAAAAARLLSVTLAVVASSKGE